MEPTPATVKNRGAAKRKARGRVEAYMTTPENRRQTDPATRPHRAGQREEKQREDDLDELREAMEGAMNQAERDEQASQAAREDAGDVREVANIMGGRTVHDDGTAEIFLHEVLQATERNQETAEADKRRKGKAPAGEEPMRTPDAATQRQTTPAMARYMG